MVLFYRTIKTKYVLDQVQRFCLTEPRLLHRESGMGAMDFISRSGHATVTASDFAEERTAFLVTEIFLGKAQRNDELKPGELPD